MGAPDLLADAAVSPDADRPVARVAVAVEGHAHRGVEEEQQGDQDVRMHFGAKAGHVRTQAIWSSFAVERPEMTE